MMIEAQMFNLLLHRHWRKTRVSSSYNTQIIMKFIETKNELPKAEFLTDNSGTYYLILIEGFGSKLAMFLENENGEKEWYSDYTSKIFRNVICWCRIVSE